VVSLELAIVACIIYEYGSLLDEGGWGQLAMIALLVTAMILPCSPCLRIWEQIVSLYEQTTTRKCVADGFALVFFFTVRLSTLARAPGLWRWCGFSLLDRADASGGQMCDKDLYRFDPEDLFENIEDSKVELAPLISEEP